jgi:hypothetical protein
MTVATPDLISALLGALDDAGLQITRRWTVESAAAHLRPALANLANPIVRGSRRDLARAIVREFIDTAPANLLAESNVRLRHELGVAKFTRLHELIAESRA